LGKGGIVAKDLQINHPINASIKIHSESTKGTNH